MIKVGVGCFILNKNNQILIGRRLNSIGHGTLALPGGHLEFGESFEQCAAREVEEETSLKLDNWRFGTAVSSMTESQHYVTIFMCAKHNTDIAPVTTEPQKCEGWSWINWEDLKKIPSDQLFKPLDILFQERERFTPLTE